MLSILSGCASYRQTSLPELQADQAGRTASAVAEPLTKVRLSMMTGGELYGYVVQVTESEIVLSRKNDGIDREPAIAISDIHSIAIEGNSATREVILAVVVVAAAGIVFVAHELSHMEPLN